MGEPESVEVSLIVITDVFATLLVRPESVYNLITNFSSPSVVVSAAIVCWKVNWLLDVVPLPCQVPEEKSETVTFPVCWSKVQYKVVPSATLLVVTVVVRVSPSFIEVLDGAIT